MSTREICRAAPVALLAALAAPLGADLDFPNFSNPQNLTFVGSAIVGGGYLQLTQNQGWEAGAAWYDIKQTVSNGFDTTFEYRMTPPNGADGMAFVIHNDHSMAIGLCGGSQGASSGTSTGCATGNNTDILEALVVSIDIWANGEYADPDSNHVAVHVQQTGTNELIHHNNALGSYTAPFDLNDGAPHQMRVAYDGVQTLDVYLVDLTTPVLSLTIDIAQTLNLDNGSAWVGFTGATGGAQQLHAVKSWSFTESSGYLFADQTQLSLANGGVCNFNLSTGPTMGGNPYLLMGSHSGTSPGIPIDAVHTLPLNIDAYWQFTVTSPNVPPLSGSFGTLDASGKGKASFTLPGGANPAFAGIAVHHAFVAIDLVTTPATPGVGYTSEAVTFTFVP